MVFCTFLLGVLLGACTSEPEEPVPDVTPQVPEYPSFILDVVPRNAVSTETYLNTLDNIFVLTRGVVVRFIVADLGFEFDLFDAQDLDPAWQVISGRISLVIDDQKISDDTLVGGFDGELGSGLVLASWTPSLSSGSHTATFTLLDSTEQKHEYSWEIILK
jgi:hypothetical protein